jgi:uncharacterized protein (TIGR02246 family)
MQRLTMKMDSETSAEETSHAHPSVGCNACGHPNREGNRFCAMCGERLQSPTEEGGTPLLSSAASSPSKPRVERRPSQDFLRPEVQPEAASPETRGEREEIEAATSAAPGTHHYHHHYHHHYFPGGSESASTSSRGAAPEIARETDRLRIAAAAKGEPITRNEAAVRRITQEWVLACNTRQLDELLDLYAPDALVLRSNLPMLRGAAQVREFFFSALESGLGEVSLEPMRVEIVGDVAHEVGRYSALVPGTSGKRREERGKYLWVFAKQSGGDWKLVSECWSSDLTLTNAESDIPKAVVAGKAQQRK